jgi:hypothetical protein
MPFGGEVVDACAVLVMQIKALLWGSVLSCSAMEGLDKSMNDTKGALQVS